MPAIDKHEEGMFAAGAQAMLDSQAVPTVGTISILTDPQGAMFGLIQGGEPEQ